MKRLLATAGLTALVSFAPTCFAQIPALTHSTPSAVAPGKTLAVTLHGTSLGGATTLWTSFGARADKQTNDSKQAAYNLTLPSDTPTGIGAVWLATTNGVSNLLLLMVDELPTIVADVKSLGTRETAQELQPPVAVEGACKAGRVELFKFTAKAGQSVSAEVVAARLGSKLDPQLRLLDATGRELAFADDTPGLGADCRLLHRFTADTTCFIEVRDVSWQGGADYRFRLRVGDFPLVATPYPLVAADVRRLTSSQTQIIQSLLTSAATEVLEIEPNDTAAQATPFTPPCALNGRFAAPRDRDWFSFTAQKGQRLLFTSETRRAGSPTDLLVRVESADGAVLAESDAASTNDVALDVTFKQDGPARVLVEDLLRRGGPEFAYRLRVEPFAPGFTLNVETNRFNPPCGGVFTARVTAQRRGYDGPITLAFSGPAEKFQLTSNVIVQGKSETTLRAELPEDVPPGTLLVFNVVGRATLGGGEFTATASTLGTLARALPTVPFPPASLDGVVALGVGPALPDFFQLALATNEVRFPAAGGKSEFTVRVTAVDKAFTAKVVLAFAGLPAGLTAKVTKEPKGAGDYVAELTSTAAVAEGEHAFQIVGTGTFRDQTRRVTLAKVLLRIGK